MFSNELTTSVLDFAKLFANIPDTDLDRAWHWKGHDEGVRFACFVANRELRELAVRLLTTQGPLKPSEYILAQYHAAFLDLQAILYGLSHEDSNLPPTEKDWTIRRTLAHIVGADIGFTAVIRFALNGHRAGTWIPQPMSDEDEIQLIGMSEIEYQALMKSSYENLLAFHQGFHNRIVDEFSSIGDDELDLPAVFWEPENFSIRYRLHRYEAHMRQHTIQIEKTLSAIDLAPNEPKRLIHMLFSALSNIDEALIGARPVNQELCQKTIDSINGLTHEIIPILSQPDAPANQSNTNM